MGMIVTRAYREADWPRVEAIHDAARRNELALAGLSEAFLPLAIAAEREGLFDYTVRVAELDGEVAGFIAFDDGELAWLYVDPDKGRRGIGRRLIADAVEGLAGPLELEVLQGNEPALRLYESMGFVRTETASGRMPGNETFRVTVHRLTRA